MFSSAIVEVKCKTLLMRLLANCIFQTFIVYTECFYFCGSGDLPMTDELFCNRTPEEIFAAKGVKPTLSPNLDTLALVEVTWFSKDFCLKCLCCQICSTQVNDSFHFHYLNFQDLHRHLFVNLKKEISLRNFRNTKKSLKKLFRFGSMYE